MKKVLLCNFDVGSGVEYCGNIFSGWLRERNDIVVKEIKDQNPDTIIINQFIDFSPDIVILNEEYERTMRPTFYYKKFYPKTKVLLLNHSWKHFFINPDTLAKDDEKIKWHFFRTFYTESCNIIINLNCKPDKVEWPFFIRNKILNSHFPIDPSFRNDTEWNSRDKMFLIVGNISPLKISEGFISAIKESGLKFDCYGEKFNGLPEKYINKFDTCKEIKHKGAIPQDKVSEVMNQYKYFVMPHNGTEVFNLTLLQAILSGTIPIVCNDRNSKDFDATWIDWADGLYFGCNTPTELVKNLLLLSNERPDHTEISNGISKFSSEKFSYEKTKLTFSVAMKYLISEDDPHGSTSYQ